MADDVKNPALLPLFAEVKALLVPYAAHFEVRNEGPGRYELYSTVNVRPKGKPRYEPMFAAVILQKSYVGFYYMPIYSDPDEARAFFGGDLLALLKGKSCFHLKRLTPVLREQVAAALARGLELYRERGWA